MRSSESVSPSSSPPSSPFLPISFAPGNQTYTFTPSPSPSPPFSLSSSSHCSADNLPRITSAFSLDQTPPDPGPPPRSKSSCLKDLIDWFIRRCCQCFSLFRNPSSRATSSRILPDMSTGSSSIHATKLG